MPFISGTSHEQQFYAGDKPCGPTFFVEIEEHGGLMNQHWTLHTPGWFLDPNPTVAFEFFEDTPQGVIDGVIEVYESHNPKAK